MTSGVPRPGRPVAGSESGRPIIAAFDLLSRRWALRIIWELDQAGAALTFRALRQASGGISSSVLSRRLAELGEYRIIEHAGGGYHLTPTGERLVMSFDPLLEWSRGWAAELQETRRSSLGVDRTQRDGLERLHRVPDS
jgi:DNA-binding HxlR family transcriptional regulator